MENYANCNTLQVLDRVKKMGKTGKSYKMTDVYEELSIFDWWVDFLNHTRLKEMETFLREAHRLGFDGYVCFKVGITGCANGMWAYKEKSTNGYSPDNCPCLYKSFTPAYNYWSFCLDGKTWIPDGDNWNSIKTIRQLEEEIKKVRENG